ncbi:MAG TPA: hypothetical protein VGO09_00855 [Flavisolibacter sp.]|jgi:hypothetical protein|nr:hypothetical protein [Flavisolibacter sp.]
MEINFKYLTKDLLDHLYFKADLALKNALLNGADFSEIREKERILTQISIERHRTERPDNFGKTPADTPFRT